MQVAEVLRLRGAFRFANRTTSLSMTRTPPSASGPPAPLTMTIVSGEPRAAA
jgi:hypothetical protein